MRFLDTASVQLQDVRIRPLPPYAILSHTWGEGDSEVTFDDMQPEKRDGIADLKPVGFRKLEQACKLALVESLKYIWIDTCCIDKSSSAELSEAINSMYRYYSDASICFAYLTGVRSDENPLSQKSGFCTCRWFTRAWTLQELLAPRAIAFYAEDWKMIGTRISLRDPIAEITRIPVEVLVNSRNPSEFSIAQRMSWAAGRKATRDEDIGYSLMGLFGVYMPTIYGEGHHAFRRLQLQIMQSSNDQSIFAWRTNGYATYSGLLSDSPDAFSLCANIVAGETSLSEVRMTNRGIHISLPLVSMKDDSWSTILLALLNCHEEGRMGYVAIEMLSVGVQEYWRIEPQKLYIHESFPNNEDVQAMYITEPSVPRPDSNIDWQIIIVDLLRMEYFLNEYFLNKNTSDHLSNCTFQADGRLCITISVGATVALRFTIHLTKEMFVVMLGVSDANHIWVDIMVMDEEMRNKSTREIWDTFCADDAPSFDGDFAKWCTIRATKSLRRRGSGMESVSAVVRKYSSNEDNFFNAACIIIHDATRNPLYEWTVDIEDLNFAHLTFLPEACPELEYLPVPFLGISTVRLRFSEQPLLSVLSFQEEKRSARWPISGASERLQVFIVLGVHKKKPWTSVVVNFGEENAEDIKRSFLNVSRRERPLRRSDDYEHRISAGRSVLTNTRVCGETSFDTKVTVKHPPDPLLDPGVYIGS